MTRSLSRLRAAAADAVLPHGAVPLLSGVRRMVTLVTDAWSVWCDEAGTPIARPARRRSETMESKTRPSLVHLAQSEDLFEAGMPPAATFSVMPA